MTPILRNDNHADINILASMVELIPDSHRLYFSSLILGQDLFRISLFNTWIVRLVAKWKKCDEYLIWYRILERSGKWINQRHLIKDFVRHIHHGDDKYDPRSVGGLSQPEIDKLLDILVIVLPTTGVPVYDKVLDEVFKRSINE